MTNFVAGKYHLFTDRCEYCQKFESIKEIVVDLTAQEAEILINGTNPLFKRLGFGGGIELIKEYET